MLMQVVGCSHHGTSLRRPGAAGLHARANPRGARPLAAGVSRCRGRVAVDLQPGGNLRRHGTRVHAHARTDRQVPGPLPRPRSGRGHRLSVRAQRRGRRAALVQRGRQSGQHGSRRAANPGPGETGVPGGHRAGQHRPADARRVSGGAARGAAGGQRNQPPSAPREHSQRGGGRLRPPDLRTLRRQGNAGHRRRRNGRRDAPLLAGGGVAPHHGREPALRPGRGTGRAVAWPRRGLGRTAAGARPPPIW